MEVKDIVCYVLEIVFEICVFINDYIIVEEFWRSG